MCKKTWFCIPNSVLILFGILLGVTNALVWYYGFIPYVRPMIPYALIFAIILFVLTAILKARCGNSEEEGIGGLCLTSTCASLRRYSPTVLITSAIFIVFSIVVLATFLPFFVRTVLAFIGCISFWCMLFVFLGMVFCMLYKR